MASRAYASSSSSSSFICRNCLRDFRLPRMRPVPPRYLSEASSRFRGGDFETGSFRRELKEERKSRSREKQQARRSLDGFGGGWIITCGLEIHAQLNTRRKLFSDAKTSSAAPNTNIAPFDAALPGTQPTFNPATLLPALRASLALNCAPAASSSFDRKHYFYWDQPAGYQITQFYSPLARDGHVTLFKSDGVDTPDSGVRVEIKQVQMEQDTGKTLASAGASLIDLNRVGTPLLEIITHPFDVPDTGFAAAVVRKIQATLRAVGACVVGMEWGGLRADVNVSVRRSGVDGLGRRCEIKNLSSLKVVEEAITAEARRQIRILEDGGVVEGETRGWDAEIGETRRLRGKEGEVDYRYMPDPDLLPVVLGEGLVERIKDTLPPLPDEILAGLVGPPFGLSVKDARTLMGWDEGRTSPDELAVVEFYKDIVKRVEEALCGDCEKPRKGKEVGKIVGNWVVHELGGQLATNNLEWRGNPIDAVKMADLIAHLLSGKISGPTAKHLLSALMSPTESRSVAEVVEQEKLAITPLTDEELFSLIETAILSDDQQTKNMLQQVKALDGDNPKAEKKRKGLVNWFVGKVMREVAGRVQADRVEAAVERVLKER